MNMEDVKEYVPAIKKAVREGKTVVAPRRTGKTTAILELLLEESDSYMMVDDYRTKIEIIELLRKVEDRIITKASEKDWRGLKIDKLYGDNIDFNKYDGAFKHVCSGCTIRAPKEKTGLKGSIGLPDESLETVTAPITYTTPEIQLPHV